jgi:lipid II:glycine glycyltransferase (peptidoglycan interpeptide bridge formation enzyme)
MNEYNLGLPPIEWDQRQYQLGGHMLQGYPWAHFQASMGRNIVWNNGGNWSWIGMLMGSRGIRFLYIPYGPTARSEEDLKSAIDNIKLAAKKLNLHFIRCEPVGLEVRNYNQLGLKPTSNRQPSDTLVIDLTKTEEELRAALSPSLRNTINSAGKKGIELSSTTDLAATDVFLDLLHKTAGDRHYNPFPDSHYKKLAEDLISLGKGKFFIASFEGHPVSVTFCMDYLRSRAYMYTGNDPEYRKLRATGPLVWKIITDSKAEGFSEFDLWGVAPLNADSSHPWAGFSEFKRSFGGRDIHYNGTFEIPISKLMHKAYKLVKKVKS